MFTMLTTANLLKEQLNIDQDKLNKLLTLRKETPEEYNKNTAHLSTYSTLFPYIYHKTIIQQHLKKGKKILDWGAYLGQVTYLLQDDYDVTAFNIAPQKDISYWHKALGIKQTKFKKFDTNTKFDAVVSSGVLEHTFEFGQTDVEALKALHSVLNDDGYLFIWHLPTKHALAEKIAMMKKSWKHILRYELDDILVKLNLTGFEIVKIEINDFIFSKLVKVLPFLDIVMVWKIDYMLVHLPPFKRYAHHFTIVAKKLKDFPRVPATSGYTTYI